MKKQSEKGSIREADLPVLLKARDLTAREKMAQASTYIIRTLLEGTSAKGLVAKLDRAAKYIPRDFFHKSPLWEDLYMRLADDDGMDGLKALIARENPNWETYTHYQAMLRPEDLEQGFGLPSRELNNLALVYQIAALRHPPEKGAKAMSKKYDWRPAIRGLEKLQSIQLQWLEKHLFPLHFAATDTAFQKLRDSLLHTEEAGVLTKKQFDGLFAKVTKTAPLPPRKVWLALLHDLSYEPNAEERLAWLTAKLAEHRLVTKAILKRFR